MPENKQSRSMNEEIGIKKATISKSEHSHDIDAGFTFKTRNNILAIISLLLSISSVLIGPIGLLTCIPGIICGHIAIKQCKDDPTLRGKGFAVAGMVTGYVFLGLFFLVIIIIGGFIFIN